MKIVFFETKITVYGGQQAVLARCSALQKMGVDFEIVHPFLNSKFYELLKTRGLAGKIKKINFWLGGRSKIVNTLQLCVFTLKHYRGKTHIFHFDSFETAYPISLCRRVGLLSNKMAFTIRSDRYNKFGLVDKFLLNSFDSLITNSNFSKSIIESKIDKSGSVSVHYSPIDLERIRNSVPQKEDSHSAIKEIRVSYVGSIEPRKKLDFFVRACVALIETGQEIKVNIFGDFKDSEGEEYYKSVLRIIPEGMIENFEFFGFKEISVAITLTDLLVCPYENEPLGRVVPEFLYCGRAVVVSDSGGLQEAGCGYAKAYAAGSLDDCLSVVKEEISALRNGASNAPAEIRDALHQKFSSEACTGRDIQVYEKLTS